MKTSDYTPEERARNIKIVISDIQDVTKISIFYHKKKPRHEARITIQRASLGLGGICHRLWGGSMYELKRRRLQKAVTSCWQATGKNAYGVVQDVWPYLVGAQQVRAVILKEFYEECFLGRGNLGKGRRARLSDEEFDRREWYMQRMKCITDMENSK